MIKVLSIIESSLSPNCVELYKKLEYSETRVNSMRKGIAKIKTTKFDYIVCEFAYGYANDYAGVTVSNLDVMLYSLQKYSPDTRVVVMVDKSEKQYIVKLTEILNIHAVLVYQETNMNDLADAVTS